ncbi:MAG: hypothetical protein R3F61_35760 [Myxococcota bacterium]
MDRDLADHVPEELAALAARQMLPGVVEPVEALPHHVGVHLLQLPAGQLVLRGEQGRLELPLLDGQAVELALGELVVEHVPLHQGHQELLPFPAHLRDVRLQAGDAVPERREQRGVRPVGLRDGLLHDGRIADGRPHRVEARLVHGLGPDPLDVAGVLPRLLVPDALVVEVPPPPASRARRGHRVAAGAADHVHERELVVGGRLGRALPLDVVVQDRLHAVEGLLVDECGVLALEHVVAVGHLAQVDPVPEHAAEVLGDPALAPADLALLVDPALLAVAALVQPLHQLHRGPELLVPVEDDPDERGLLLVDLEVAGAGGVVAEDRGPAVPQPALGPGAHGDAGALGGLLALELGEHEHQLEHRAAHRGARVELLAEGAELDLVLLEELVHLEEVEEAPAQPVDPGDDDEVDVALADALEHALERGPLEVLAAGALLAKHLDDLVGALAGLDVGAEAGLLGVEAPLLLLGLDVGADARVDRDANGLDGVAHGAPCACGR